MKIYFEKVNNYCKLHEYLSSKLLSRSPPPATVDRGGEKATRALAGESAASLRLRRRSGVARRGEALDLGRACT